ncbi:glutathione S-transferase family protein [Motiliproteus sediminis]|uniref:glutathione S-transferase family protein n=1 Tax=Motiliproteus sediminis TaxID=1468178 RepID=UPI001AEFAD5A|nr:glutathione S-transferase C-terminal domain-containing protein [Motiliproteus sediminis]
MLVEGKWVGRFKAVQGKDAEGGFVRQPSQFRHWVGDDERFPLEAERYHLYVCMICPWACRTLAVRALLGLETVISVSRAKPALTDQGWAFEDQGELSDPFLGAAFMHEIYTHSDPHYTGRATVPVLWDKKQRCIVNNESADIIRMLNDQFRPLATRDLELFPSMLADEQERLSKHYYEQLNNGVYRAGFATTQVAYERAVKDVFCALDELEQRLSGRSYLLGEQLTALDIRIFVTLVRFDVAYHGAFKCNLRRIADYPNLSRYLRHLYRLPGMAETVDIDAIKQGYYSIRDINPTGVVPLGPFSVAFLD